MTKRTQSKNISSSWRTILPKKNPSAFFEISEKIKSSLKISYTFLLLLKNRRVQRHRKNDHWKISIWTWLSKYYPEGGGQWTFRRTLVTQSLPECQKRCFQVLEVQALHSEKTRMKNICSSWRTIPQKFWNSKCLRFFSRFLKKSKFRNVHWKFHMSKCEKSKIDFFRNLEKNLKNFEFQIFLGKWFSMMKKYFSSGFSLSEAPVRLVPGNNVSGTLGGSV